jgi:hypothetical protein
LGRARIDLLIELFTQSQYCESIREDADLSELFKDVFLFHWKEESQHAILDELEASSDVRMSQNHPSSLEVSCPLRSFSTHDVAGC